MWYAKLRRSLWPGGSLEGGSLSLKMILSWEKHRTRPLWGSRLGSYRYRWYSYDEIFARAQEVGSYIVRSGFVKQGDVVVIHCPASSDWLVADLACALYGLVSLPVDTLAGQQTLAHLYDLAQPKAILCTTSTATSTHLHKVVNSTNTKVIALDAIDFGTPTFKPDKILHMSEEEDRRHLFTLQPTSGSTGHPKLLRRTRWNWSQRDGDADTTMLLGSLTSPAPRSWVWLNLLAGGATAESSVDTLVEDCQMVHPTQVSAPPLVWDDLCEKINSGRFGVTADPETGVVDWTANLFGPRCKALTNTGAAISPTTLASMKRLFRAGVVHDGYGSSEAGGIAVDGELLQGVEIRLRDVPDLGYFATDTPYPRGELLVRTTTMFDGYHSNNEGEREGKDAEGWLATGDIVQLKGPRRIEVIDRRSSCVKLSHGKYVAPTLVEHTLQGSPLVHQVYVHIDAVTSKLVAVVVPQREYLVSHLSANSQVQVDFSAAASIEVLCDSPAVQAEVLEELQKLQRASNVSPHEQIRGIILTPEPFTTEKGLLTPSLKPRRQALGERYGYLATQQAASASSGNISTPEATILRIIHDVLGRPAATEEEWDAIGLDSLAATQLAQQLSSTFGTSVSISAIFRSRTVGNLMGVVLGASSLNERRDVVDTEAELSLLAEDIALPLPPRVVSNSAVPTIRQNKTSILLTGATGFLGAHLLDQLLLSSESDTEIVCLIRGSANRLKETLQKYGVSLPPTASDRLKILAGDLRSPQFGMAAEQWKKLQASLDAIVHCGAHVNWVLPYSGLRTSNTLPTLPLLNLAQGVAPSTSLPKTLHYVSSIAVAEPGSCETRSPEPNIEYGYGASKWAAEELLARAERELGNSIVYYRPGHLVPVQQPGGTSLGFNRDDYLALLIRACVHAGGYPDLPESTTTEWTCVATTAHLIAQSVMKRLRSVRLPSHFNLITDKPTPYRLLFDALRERYPNMSPIQTAKWKQAVSAPDSPMFALSSVVSELSGSKFRISHTHHNRKYLSDRDWPEVTLQSTRAWVGQVAT